MGWPVKRKKLDVPLLVMAGLVPAIHVLASVSVRTWMPGTSPGMMRETNSPRQRRLHQAAGFAEIHLPGIFCLEHRDHLAHVLHPGRAGLGDGRCYRSLHIGLRHLLRQVGLDDRDFLALLFGELGAAALVVELDRFLALLDHF